MPEFPTDAPLGQHRLKSQCAIDRLHCTRKLRKNAVAGRVGNPTSVLSHQFFGCSTHRPESSKCRRLIRLHQA